MNEFELLEAVGGIDGRYVEAASAGKGKTGRKKAYFSAAACLVLVIGCVCLARPWQSAASVPGPPAPNPNGAIERTEAPDVYPENPIILRPGDEGYIDPVPTPEPTTSSEPAGVYIPPVELPEGRALVDMIGLVIYRGGIYTQAESYWGDEARAIEPLVCEYLGTASGTIDEWSCEEEYTKEWASSVAGDVYAVRGYDTDFRICVKCAYQTKEGGTELFVEFLERLNDVTLHTGEDLFGERLHLRERVESIRRQSHADWNVNGGGIREAELPEGAWDAFLDALYAGDFENTWRGTEPFYDEPYSTVYDTPEQTHLILTMDDGTTVRLRLIKGGYVGYDPLGWYLVKMPGEAFDAVYTACK